MTVSAFMANKKTLHPEGLRAERGASGLGQPTLPLRSCGQAQPQVRGARVISRRVSTPGAGRKSAPRRLLLLEQLLEERAVVDHRRAQVLGRGVAALVRDRDPVGGPV